MVDEDKVLKAQWGMMTLALCCGIVYLKAMVLDTDHQEDADPSFASVGLLSLKDEINHQVAAPLAHALHLARGYFNDISSKRHKRIAKGVHNQQLGK